MITPLELYSMCVLSSALFSIVIFYAALILKSKQVFAFGMFCVFVVPAIFVGLVSIFDQSGLLR